MYVVISTECERCHKVNTHLTAHCTQSRVLVAARDLVAAIGSRMTTLVWLTARIVG